MAGRYDLAVFSSLPAPTALQCIEGITKLVGIAVHGRSLVSIVPPLWVCAARPFPFERTCDCVVHGPLKVAQALLAANCPV